MDFLQLLIACNDQSNPQIQDALTQVNVTLSDPGIIQSIIEVISNKDIDIRIRRFAAFLMCSTIRNHYKLYIDNAQEIFNDLLSSMVNESDEAIAKGVSHALCRIFESYSEDWGAMVEFINHTCSSNSKEIYRVGTIFLTEFIPYVSSRYIAAMHATIIPLLNNLLSDYSSDNEYGFKLFEAVQLKDYDPYPEADIEYAKIFHQMLLLFQQSLLDGKRNVGILSQCIGHSMMRDTPFDSPTNFFQYLLEIISNESIPTEFRHYPLIPINKLVKYHGKELRSVIAPAIPQFLSISASQFRNENYISEGGSRSIIDLFTKLSKVTNGDEFFQYLMSIVSQEGDPALSFASLCAIYGASDELIEQFEQNMAVIMEYIYQKLQIVSKPVVEICLIMLCDLVDRFSDSISSSINNIISLAFTFATNSDLDVSKEAISLISIIFQNIDLETSVVLSHMQNLKEFYEKAPILRTDIMSAIGSAIYSCGQDFKPYATLFAGIISDGLRSEDPLLVISSVEALGFLIRFAADQIGELYSEGMQFIIEHSKDEEDLNMREASMTALYNIINQNNQFNFEGKSIDAFIPLVLIIANCAIGIQIENEDLYAKSDDVTKRDIAKVGFTLLKALLKYHYRGLAQMHLVEALPKQFKDFMQFPDKYIAIEAIKASVYFLINFQTDSREFFEIYAKILSGEDTSRCEAVFRAYNKLLIARCKPAIEIFPSFSEIIFAALSRKLLCQRLNCDSEEERYDFDYDLLEPVYSILSESFKIDISFFKPEQLLELMNFLISKVDDIESIEILGTLGDYIMNGGVVNNELVQFAFKKLEEINYQKSPDAIFFIRAIIKNHPELVSELAASLVQFFIVQLKSEESDKQYYWSAMMNVIAAVFEMHKSEQLSSIVPMNAFIPLILNKLPVQGDIEEAEFIYSSLIEYLRENEAEIGQNVAQIFRVLVLTLSLKTASLDDFKLQEQTINSMVELMKLIIGNQPQFSEEIPGILNDDVRLARLNSRIFGQQGQ